MDATKIVLVAVGCIVAVLSLINLLFPQLNIFALFDRHIFFSCYLENGTLICKKGSHKIAINVVDINTLS